MNYQFPTSRTTFLIRGLTHACPRCGSRNTHAKYFTIRNNCPVCDLKFEKEQGYWTGALALNFIFTGGLVAIGLALGLILTVPEIPIIPLMAILFPIAIIVPIVSYPFTFTLWMAIDYGFLSRLDD